jgi:hypothetical protein
LVLEKKIEKGGYEPESAVSFQKKGAGFRGWKILDLSIHLKTIIKSNLIDILGSITEVEVLK